MQPGKLGLTDAELDRITAEPLQIGDADSVSGADHRQRGDHPLE